MKNLRQLARRSGLFFSGKQGRRSEKSKRGSASRVLGSETLEKRQLLAGDVLSPQHNYWNGFDVNDDQQITALDALVVINRLGRESGEGEIAVSGEDDSSMFYDVNADHMISALDALQVMNAIGRGEEVGELIELQLNALRDPTLGPSATNTVTTIDIGETFHLEVSYEDLRFFGDQTGAFKLITDLVADQDGILVPILNETQEIFIGDEIFTQPFASSITIGIDARPDNGQADTVVSSFADFANGSIPEIQRIMREFGYTDSQFQVRSFENEANDQAFRIFYVGDEFANVDVGNLTIEVNENGGPDVPTNFIEYAPFEADGVTPNSDAVQFNINAFSRTFNDGEKFYSSLPQGSFGAGGIQIGGTGPTGTGGGVPEFSNTGTLPEPFDAFSIPVQLRSAVTNLVVSVTPANNNEAVLLYGRDEPLTSDLVLLDGDHQVTLSTTPVANPGEFSIDPTTLSVNEDAGTATFTVNRTGGSAGAVSVGFATSNGTATAGADYTANSGTLNFADGVTSQTFTVSITDDTDDEADETFTILIASPTGGATVGNASTSTVTIVDNDPVVNPVPGVLSISPATVSVNEDAGTATFTVNRTGGTDGAITVDFATANGTATAGSDYTANTGTLNFADGVDSQTITVAITDDTDDEANETFTVSITSPTGGATLGTVTSSTATIVDNDNVTPVPGVLSITPATVSVNEGDGTVTFTVNRTDGSDGAVSVNFATANVTATAGSDYVSNTGTLNFLDGETSKTITVTITDDDTDEPDENFTVSISDPTGGATLGSVTSSTATIVDNDDAPVPGVLSISPATVSVDEDGSTVTLTVNRTGGSDGAVAVSFASANGTATAGSDYTATSGTLNFADGETSKTISIDITDDTTEEPSETFVVAITGPTGGATLGSVDSSTVTILDNDAPVNNPPTSGPVTVSATEDIAASFLSATLLANASPGAGETSTQTVSISSVPATSTNGGTVEINSGGGIDYSPAADFNGADSFVVTITDDGTPAKTATFTVTVNVAAVNDDPVATNDTASAISGQPATIIVLTNDSAGPSNEDDALIVVAASSNQGSVAINQNGTLTFTPDSSFVGNATINYTIEDSDGAQDSAVVTVSVTDFEPVTFGGSIFIDNVESPTNPVRDGIMNGLDKGIGGIRVRLVSSTDATVASAITAVDGSYSFSDVSPGNYTVVFDLPPGKIRELGSRIASVVVDPNSSTPPVGPSLSVEGTKNTGLESIAFLSSSYLRRNGAIAGMSNGGSEGAAVSFDENGNQQMFIAGEGFEDVVFGEVLLSSFGDSAVIIIVREGASAPEVATIDSEFFVKSSVGQSIQFFGGVEDFDFVPVDGEIDSVDLARYQAAIDRAMMEM